MTGKGLNGLYEGYSPKVVSWDHGFGLRFVELL